MSTLKQCPYFFPYNSELVARARQLRKNQTPAETKLWQFLRQFPSETLGQVKFWRQRPIDHFIIDFHCPKLKLVIEIDGAAHFTEDGKTYDQERSHILESYGLRIIRFTNHEILPRFRPAVIAGKNHRLFAIW